MKEIAFTFLFLFSLSISGFSKAVSELSIIQEPVSIEVREGNFSLLGNTDIIIKNIEIKSIEKMLVNMPSTLISHSLHMEMKTKREAFVLKLSEAPNVKIDNAGYTLQVTRDNVVIAANKSERLFYGIQIDYLLRRKTYWASN